MLEKLLEFVVQLWEQITPVFFVKEYEGALLFRGGRFRKELSPGVHWKVPWYDDIDKYVVATTTFALPAQSVVTRDGKSVVIKSRVKYKVTNLRIYGVKVTDALDALSDMICGIQFDLIRSMTWEESCGTNLNEVITSEARKEARKWGITVDAVTVTDHSEMASFRLINEGGKLPD